MKLNNILYVSISLAVLVGTAYANEAVDCAVLGYKNKVKDCPASVGQPLICPTSTALSSEKPCLCLTSSCRDYPLIKDKNGTFYVIGSGGSKKQVNSDWTMYFDGGIEKGLEECTTGHGEDAVTYYRIIKCKDDVNGIRPIYNNGLCMNGCDRKIYPYDVHPGNLAGKVEDCQDSKGIYYGYTECNDGWEKNGGRCELHSCQIMEYPYTTEPNLINNEKRGEITSCKVGGNTYYKYTSCSGGFTKVGNICVKTCDIKTEACDYDDMGNYKNWSCSFSTSKCRIGDYAAINGKIIGIIAHLGIGPNDKNRIIPNLTTFPRSSFAQSEAASADIDTIPNTTNIAQAKNFLDGKANTAKIRDFAEKKGWKPLANYYKAADYCLTYKPDNCNKDFCQAGEWYWVAEGELNYIYENRYMLYNALNLKLPMDWYVSSSEANAASAWEIYFPSGVFGNYRKTSIVYYVPMLMF